MNNSNATLFAEDILIAKAARKAPMSLSDLFKMCFGKRLDKYNPEPKEYIRLIACEVERLRYDLQVSRAGNARMSKEMDKLRQEELFPNRSCL